MPNEASVVFWTSMKYLITRSHLLTLKHSERRQQVIVLSLICSSDPEVVNLINVQDDPATKMKNNIAMHYLSK